MGFFDDALKGAVPGGDLTKPIAIAAGALLLGRMLGGGQAPAPARPADPAAPPPAGGGGLLDGLSDLMSKLGASGQSAHVNSWVGSGANMPIQPSQLGSALGQQTISQLAARAGVSEQELLAQLAQVLPGLVNNLTPNGRLPTAAELAAQGR
jgi:uncharacterized protein YidB (DUF937 family)